MKTRIAVLAKQLLGSVPQGEMKELIAVLNYFNSNFNDEDRVLAMEQGSDRPPNAVIEKEIRESLEKSAGSQSSYITSGQGVCRCCGK